MNNNLIIVTGGAGFIGSNIIRGLNDLGEDNIIVVDNFTNTDKFKNLNGLKIADCIQKEDFLEKLTTYKGAKAIFHMGACSSTTETNGTYLIKNNYEYSKILVDFSIKNKIKFIYASSASVYGNGDNGFDEKRENENPLNGYSFTKFAFDNYVRKINTETQIVGLRYFNVYGYQENHKGDQSSVILKFFKQFNENENITIFKGSENIHRDFIFIEDVVKVTLFFYKKNNAGIFNCGTGNTRTFADMAHIFKNLEPRTKIVEIPFPKHLKGKYQYYTKANISKLLAVGYDENFYSLETGMKKYLTALKTNSGYYTYE
ncbi:MAG: ADP-glyceromanno-heptose 6-epimerase [Gammaproteobacteria bacterium]|nr:ADP-glyceromanno-heptose 6-epimerase [Gammaproteobacteria bacterium]